MTSHPPSPHRHHDDPLPLPLPQSPRQLRQDLLMSVSALVCFWARKATQALSRKVTSKDRCQWDGSGRSPDLMRKKVRPAKRLLSNISSKAISLVTNPRRRKEEVRECEEEYEFDFGDGGVWQRTIMMGDKCQPLDFSGVIYYDESGKQLNHIPLRSPRSSPLPGYLANREDGKVPA